ncbi:MAG: hypothetical protein E7614_07495 [Ruminococcaceae bacterium]|nr:hypothetical protein [Oscillospiraceae bacterium]
MNIIRRIRIENIKGIQKLDLSFEDLNANQPHIIVAPNGFGKSSVATAFDAATSGKLKLDPRDIYQQDQNNHPKLEIELCGENAATYIGTDECSDISTNIFIGVINSPIYAKSTARSFGQRTAATADLRVEDIVIFKKIPERKTINYSYTQIKSSFGEKGKLFLNISDMLWDFENINKLYNIKLALNKCIAQKGIQLSFEKFLNNCSNNGTASDIKNSISTAIISELRANENINALFNCISDMSKKPENWNEIDTVFTAIQICKIIGTYYNDCEREILKEVLSYLEYKHIRSLVDNRLAEFNTTGRRIVCREEKGKLVVRFDRAESMSNGERDILSFVVNLTLFEYQFSKKIGILIIDEVFDYLDGSNMLAVQYYLNQFIKNCKSKNKLLFPLIFTHLDPSAFSNYYFSKKKIHYLVAPANIDLSSAIVKMLRLRENSILGESEKEEIEKYYIHYTNDSHSLTDTAARMISDDFSDTNLVFRQKLYDEITEKYLKNEPYNPVMVIAGLRIKIEESVYRCLNIVDIEEFLGEHKVVNKLDFAKTKGIDIPELYYLLQPLYNDGMHLKGDDTAVKNKIKSCYLKTNNLHIKKMIKEVFS